MTEPVIIERAELMNIIRLAVIQANRELLQQLNKPVSPWLTQNQAAKIIGRRKLEKAMRKGLVRFHKQNPETKLGRVMVYYEDIEKLKKDPTI